MTRPSLMVSILATVAVASAQQPAGRSHVYERSVKTAGPGPQKLRIDVPLLRGGQRFDRVTSDDDGSQAHGGLADLRLLDGSGRELAYLLVTPPHRRSSWAQGAVLPIAQTGKTSGFEVDLGGPREIDAFAVDGLPAPFLKRYVLEGSGDRLRWTVLIEQGTLFDLPDERVRQTQGAFSPGPYRYLRVTWDDTNSGRVPLPRGVRARLVTARIASEPLRTHVSLQREASEPGRSRYRVELPAAGLPVVSLLLDVGAGDVFRTATVMETRFSGATADPVEIGRARLVRMEHGRSGPLALRIPIEPPRSSELQVVVEDGNNPPLPLERVAVEFADLPWIYFESPDGVVTARYGDPAAAAPQYDLEARRGAVSLAGLPEASWGEPRTVAALETVATPAPSLPDRGASVDVSGFRYRRVLPEGAGGLVALQLDAAVLAHSRGASASFADVRVVDDQGNQVPYLVERRAEPLALNLQLERATPQVRALRESTKGNRSIYSIALPYPNLPETMLVLETSDRVFQRALQVGVERQPDRQRRDMWFDVLATRTWQHADPSAAVPPLEISIAPGDVNQLLVVVDEGDNRPLTISGVRLLLPSWRLRFFRAAQPLRLIYGKPDASAPKYDLALLAPAVMSGEAREISAAPEVASGAEPASVLAPRMFWIGLGLAVAVLLALIVRLIVSGTEPPPAPPAP